MTHAEQTVWILVADAARARFYQAQGARGPLLELEDAVHPASRLPGHELLADRPGRALDSHGEHRHGMEPTIDPKDEEARRFAAELCARLRERYQAHAFTHLVLVAPPRFLGFLRNALDHQIASRVLASVDLDLTHCTTPDVVRAHLPDPLY
ncbi:MAG: host attachment protein [Pseudomonadota bacterium]|nr:host attachment protein [Pseudomonadota bacterium]